MAMAAAFFKRAGNGDSVLGCIAARCLWRRNSGSVNFCLEAEAAAYMAAMAAAEAKARGSAEGAGIGQKVLRSKHLYLERAVPTLQEEFGYKTISTVPRLEKVVVNCNFRTDRSDALVLESTIRDLYILTGQRPAIFQAKKAVAGSDYRMKDPVGCMVTLRGELMYAFLDRFMSLVLPKTRDLAGVTTYGRKGKYNMGVQDYSSVSESRFDHIHKIMGMRIALVTNSESKTEARRMLFLMGLPYMDSGRKSKKKGGRKGIRKVTPAKTPDKKGAKGAKGGAKGAKKK